MIPVSSKSKTQPKHRGPRGLLVSRYLSYKQTSEHISAFGELTWGKKKKSLNQEFHCQSFFSVPWSICLGVQGNSHSVILN